jgi:hypothetical protein
LVIGVVAGFAGSAAFAMSSLAMMLKRDDHGGSVESLVRWNMFGNATSVAAVVLITAALFAIADRVSGARRTLLLIAGWIHVGYLGWWFARPFLIEFAGETMEKLLEGGLWTVVSLVFWSATVLITVAARAWWRPATAWVTVAAVILVLFESMSWIPYLRDALADLREDHPYAGQLIWPVREVLTGGALLVVDARHPVRRTGAVASTGSRHVVVAARECFPASPGGHDDLARGAHHRDHQVAGGDEVRDRRRADDRNRRSVRVRMEHPRGRARRSRRCRRSGSSWRPHSP